MSFDLGVVAIDGWTDVAQVAAMVEHCHGLVHPEGEIDPRIAAFYERLRAEFPEEAGENAGIDHVFVNLSFSERSDPVLELIMELAAGYGLTIWDPQDGSAHRPVIAPTREDVTRWWREVLDGRAGPDETFDRVRPWVEETPREVRDLITMKGLHYLHTIGLAGVGAIPADMFERWLDDGARHDADPGAWWRDVATNAVLAVRSQDGPEPARALARRYVAEGRLAFEDVDRILS